MWTLFKALPFVWRLGSILGLVVVVVGGTAGVYGYVHHQGFVAGYADASSKYQAEEASQEAANQAAIDSATSSLAEAQIQIDIKDATIDDDLSKLDAAASQDPAGSSIALDPNSVQRLNSIR